MTKESWARGRFRRGVRINAAPEIIFGQVREDPEVEIAALHKLGVQEPVVLCIGSAGCTALSLLAAAPHIRRLTVLDINPAQLHLVRLKASLASALDLESLRIAITQSARSGYEAVRDSLKAEDRQFWDLRRSLLNRGLNHCGSVDRQLGRALRLLYTGIVSLERIRATLTAPTLEEQAKRFQKNWDSRRWRTALHLALRRATLQSAYGKAFVSRVPRDFAAQTHDSLTSLLRDRLASNNGYLWQAFLETYPPQSEEALPPYLQERYFPALKAALTKINYACSDVTGYLASQSEGSFHFLALSNVLDAATPEDVLKLFRVAFQATAVGGILCLRSFFPPCEEFRSAADRAGWKENIEFEKILERKNRSPFCGTVYVFVK